ncbi:hypothetical protein A3K29_05235 [Candidatus Collierbacteria bacterium RIFOXYB2_FULL_46_14]|nr:MAG: hypothetical protein A3K29_05235 [Candidatus Collierbacteria bacterium RIFOXYB2_FULL_46_14]OGD76539.1 MAG: hypothetical protein A3K43_05235 [Candidatus Collierbacteria bacterium RIFOXYA2_FULL_46_20]OGD77875.1 MAG: hypothetical protein A3K39_05235 [Candidatus Collierbacteria bacterium RIFOXYC2_FULL_43_15]OGD81165.1 MAG: hypothetical protein A2320_05730 [Pseudomonadales bacterium GWC2_63_15]OGD82597.1 MAG: hypothetical protein A3K36_05235 [Candidatus Collierbacteria bacterium RIFOXYD2_FUL
MILILFAIGSFAGGLYLLATFPNLFMAAIALFFVGSFLLFLMTQGQSRSTTEAPPPSTHKTK